MTTIAYDGKGTIAVDSRASRGGIICNHDEDKCIQVDGHYFFFAGDFHLAEEMVNCFLNGGSIEQCGDVAAIYVSPEGQVSTIGFYEDRQVVKSDMGVGEIYAIGSGMYHAISAMDLGKTAEQAIEHAATRDPYTGGKIRVFNVETMEFVK